MAYQSDTIATVVNRLNVRYFLPAIQREYVWNPTQILQLFDSLMRKYPISTFLFWELQPENRDKWEIYKFIDQFDERHPHNPPATTDGVQQLNLVLDGQQRLTSLCIGLKGAYVVRKKYRQWDNPNAWSKQQLYLDLHKILMLSKIRKPAFTTDLHSRKKHPRMTAIATGSKLGAYSILTVQTVLKSSLTRKKIVCRIA